jgi:L-ascorbate metabolism protein UlaG (beta-lactamase superfamily)
LLFGKALFDNIKTCRPSPGEIAFWWLGQMGVIIKTSSVTLAVDPFLSPSDARRIPPLLSPEELAGMAVPAHFDMFTIS